MTTKVNKTKPSVLEIDGTYCREGDTPERAITRAIVQPEVQAASIIQSFDSTNLDINLLSAELRAQTAAIQSGDMSRTEAMLASQAHTLDALFSNLARRAAANMGGGYLDAATTYMKLALRAQAQTVRTIEALGEIKNPKHIAFVAQANISNGHQQVNNGNRPQAVKIEKEQIKLSAEVNHELYQNTRTPSISGAVNPEVETMGAVYRPKNS